MWGRVTLFGLVGSHQQSPTGGDSPLTVSPEERKHEASRRLIGFDARLENILI